MKRQVRIFVEGRQLDLFNDETIEVNSTEKIPEHLAKELSRSVNPCYSGKVVRRV